MVANINSRNIETLRKFHRLEELSTDQLQRISDGAEWLRIKKKEILIDLDSTEDSTIFLLKGNVLLEAADGRKKIIQHIGSEANLPLSRLRPSKYRVTALTPVSFVRIDNELLQDIYESDEPSTLLTASYEVSESLEEESDPPAQLLMHIYEDLNHDRLKILSWYPVSRQITEQVLAENNDIARLVQYVMLDPVLSLKVIRASHSAAHKVPAQTGAEAVSRLGSKSLHKLVFLNLFSESSKTKDDHYKKAYLAAWERSITVSAVSRLLAEHKQHYNPDHIALAGLLHNIGELILTSYACSFPAPLTEEDLDECMQMYAVEVGKVVLSHWQMPRHLIEAVTDSPHWMRNNYTHADDVDYILVARAYTEIARKERKAAPKLDEMPAYRKMNIDVVGRELDQKLKVAATTTVDETFNFLNSTRL